MLIGIIILLCNDAENVYLSIGCCPLKAALTMYIYIYIIYTEKLLYGQSLSCRHK